MAAISMDCGGCDHNGVWWLRSPCIAVGVISFNCGGDSSSHGDFRQSMLLHVESVFDVKVNPQSTDKTSKY